MHIKATSLEQQHVWLHVLYAPDQLTARVTFFESLPTFFPDDIQHMVLGDLNAIIVSSLDSGTSQHKCQTSELL